MTVHNDKIHHDNFPREDGEVPRLTSKRNATGFGGTHSTQEIRQGYTKGADEDAPVPENDPEAGLYRRGGFTGSRPQMSLKRGA
jgi:hypothetical protein